MKIPQIEEKELKPNKDAFEYPDKTNFSKLANLPDIDHFKTPSSVAYFVLKSNIEKLNAWYSYLFKTKIDLVAAAKSAYIDRTDQLDNGYIRHVVLYSALAMFVTQVKYDKTDLKSRLNRVTNTEITKLTKTFEYGDRSNVLDRSGKKDILIRRNIKSEIDIAKKKEDEWPSVMKDAIKDGYPKKLCEQYKDKYINGNKGMFKMALANHKS